ncbi:hypothetical protein Tco_0276932 [Tanacetum coccineum]
MVVYYAMGSVLVNGSPISEFQFHKGLKQGDPLSPFLSILTMESLHLSFSKVKNAGIVTRQEEVDAAATSMGCSIFTTHFVHLEVKVGGAMSRIKSWDDVVAKVSFIKAIYGEDGALNSPSSLSKLSPWLDIICEVTVLRTKGNNLLDLIQKRSGDKEEQLSFILSRMDGLILTNIPDHWVWLLEAIGELSVKSVCQLIDDSILPKDILLVGELVGDLVGNLVGDLVGELVEDLVGELVGEQVGELVG